MTVLREPRTRLLSHYTFWRGWDPARHADWDPYDASRRAVASTWVDFLTDPSIASQTDNLVARMLLSPHPSIPLDGFIDPADDDALVSAASAVLDGFGFADVVERGPALWTALSDWLETGVEPERTLVTSLSADTDWATSITPAATAALARRTAIDARLWSRVAALQCDAVDALGDATFQRKLVDVAAAGAGSPRLAAHQRQRPRPHRCSASRHVCAAEASAHPERPGVDVDVGVRIRVDQIGHHAGGRRR